ncbi:glutamate--cysteine ligase [Streptomyces noursei]|uniref:carboxylate-amine ligase n=1 Tax=Streptomyces noursei TaxID=1971 RepID=UPI0033308416
MEEEFLLVQPDSGIPAAHAVGILDQAQPMTQAPESGTGPHPELLASMLETTTGICTTLAQVREQLTAARTRLATLAAAHDVRLLAAGTAAAPAPPQTIFPTPHYQRMQRLYGHLVTEAATCGCHVHVATPNKDASVAVINHLRPWLPTLLALSTNSPFHHGTDTGYASWRIIALSRWPTTHLPPHFASAAHYDDTLNALHTAGVLPPGANAYWLARPSLRLPTVEIRVADTAPTVDEAVLQAGLSRALVRTALDHWADGHTALPPANSHMENAALWTAARYGINGPAIDPHTGQQVPAPQLANTLLTMLRPALREAGDLDEIEYLLAQVLHHGTGADRQRRRTPEPGNSLVPTNQQQT